MTRTTSRRHVAVIAAHGTVARAGGVTYRTLGELALDHSVTIARMTT